MTFLIGINRDGWPTAIPLDRVREIRVDPEDMATVVEFRDDVERSETLAKAVMCEQVEAMWTLRALAVSEENQ